MRNTRFLEAFNTRDRARRLAAQMSAPGPVTSVTDPRFVYTTAEHTNVRSTFARIRREGSLLVRPESTTTER
jgi:hypothetical protein